MNINLDQIKKINLVEFAKLHCGFHIAGKGTAHAPRLENGKDKIVCKLQESGIWTFWSPTCEAKGTIIDLVEWSDLCTTAQAIHKLGEFIAGVDQPVKQIPAFPTSPKPRQFDETIAKHWKTLQFSQYLEERGLSRALLNHPRFVGSIKIDPRLNVTFPHYDNQNQLIGCTMKNRHFTGCAPGSKKTLWRSNSFPNDRYLVVGEAAIDMLSTATFDANKDYQRFFHSRYASTDGGWDPSLTVDALKKEIASMSELQTVFGAFDNDEQGNRYSAELAKLCIECGKEYKERIPKVCKDWNEVLQRARANELERAQKTEQMSDDDVVIPVMPLTIKQAEQQEFEQGI